MSPQVRQEHIAFACERDLSKRRACRLIEILGSGLSYALRLPARDAPVIDAMPALVGAVSALWLPAHPHLPAAPGLSPGLAPGPPAMAAGRAAVATPSAAASRGDQFGPWPLPAASANFVLAYDFVFDACANDQQIKCLTIVDEYTRECLAIDVVRLDPLSPGHRGAGPTHQHSRHIRAACARTTARSSSRGRSSSGCNRHTSKLP